MPPWQPGQFSANGWSPVGAKKTWVMMEHTTKSGEPKIVAQCTYPLTGLACVSRVYTDLAVIDLTAEGAKVLDLAQGVDFDTVQAKTGIPLRR